VHGRRKANDEALTCRSSGNGLRSQTFRFCTPAIPPNSALARKEMMNLDKLNPFSRSFFAELSKLFTDLASKAVNDDNEKVLPGSLLVEFTPDASRPESIFHISTNNEEVTVGFDWYHSHFEWPSDHSDWQMNPLTFIHALLHDRILVEVRKEAGEWAGSTVLETDEKPDLSGMEKDHVVILRSWSGRLDRVYTYSSTSGQSGKGR
jgi:hypothetical protein